MPWPPNIQRAQTRMERAWDAVRADRDAVASGKRYDVKRRNRLMAKANRAQDNFLALVGQLKKLARKP